MSDRLRDTDEGKKIYHVGMPVSVSMYPTWREGVSKFKSSTTLNNIKGHSDKVHTLSWSIDGRYLASGSVDKTARIWSVERGFSSRDSTELRGHTDSVEQVVWHPIESHRLGTASGDAKVKFWDTRTSKTLHTVSTGNTGNINMTWCQDGNYVAVGSKANTLSIIDTRTYQMVLSSPTKDAKELNECAWDPWCRSRFIQTRGEVIQIYEFKTFCSSFGDENKEPQRKDEEKVDLELLAEIHAHTSNIYYSVISLFDANSYEVVRSMKYIEDHPVRVLSFTHDGEFIAAATPGTDIPIWHVETGLPAYVIKETTAMGCVAWHPNKYLLAYAPDQYYTSSSVPFKIFGM
ncbi:WD40-repeat-containing domain protein [Paraphysoderma sedebokerense]|nr:WD40-repeat-containing domain protein [Paraphysoderma sedebokerense]